MIKHPGFKAFSIVWTGQVFSLIGTAMSGFSLGIWAWQTTESATALALMGFFGFVPLILFGPFTGALVDRWNRKLVMMLSDLASGVTTLIVLILYLGGSLQIWHLYALSFFAGIFQSFQWPAYSAAITLMVPKDQYVRASGMISLAESGSGILAPIFAGALLATTSLTSILVIDLITLAIAITALLLVRIPQPQETREGQAGRGNLLGEAVYGFRYIFERPSLLGLQLVFFFGNFFSSFGYAVLSPMILARSGNNANFLAWTESSMGLGGVLGGLAITAWGGPKRKVDGVLIGFTLSGLFCVLLGAGRNLPAWLAGGFLSSMVTILINSSNQAIWQAKVPPDVQGRVFSARRLIAQVASPLSMLLAGPLADRLMTPGLISADAPMAASLGWAAGVGPGAGMGVMIAASGILTLLAGVSGYFFKAVRNAESVLPDHQALIKS